MKILTIILVIEDETESRKKILEKKERVQGDKKRTPENNGDNYLER